MRLGCLIILCWFSLCKALAQDWATVERVGGEGNESLDALEILENGQIVVAGSFEGDLNIGDYQLSSQGEEDLYCAIYNAQGLALSAFQIGGEYEDQLAALATHQDKIALFGSYRLQVQLDTIALQTTLGTKGLFVAQYHTDGSVEWAHSIEANVLSISGDLTMNAEGDIFLTGYFYDTLIFQQDTLISNTDEGDAFVAKLNDEGELLWLQQVGDEGIIRATSVAVDSNGEVVIAGKFKGRVTFAADVIQTNTADHDVFVAKLNNDGEFVFGKKIGGVYEDDLRDITLDAENHIYITGSFAGVLAADNGWQIESTGLSTDAYLIQLSSDGTVIWGQSIGGSFNDYSAGVAVLNQQIAITGYFENSTNWGLGTQVANGATDALVAVFNNNGLINTLMPIAGNGLELGNQIKWFNNNQLLVGGQFNEQCILGSQQLEANGAYDVYWGSYHLLVNTNSYPYPFEEINMYPNPASEYIYWNENTVPSITLWDMLGRKIRTAFQGTAYIGDLPPGWYMVSWGELKSRLPLLITH